MARLPTVADFGARPTPRAYTGRPATVPNAGAVGDALEGFGSQAFKVGSDIIEKEDRLNFAAAQSELLKADIAARSELQDDPDFETFDKRYTERMTAARAQAGKLIKSRSDRALFESNSLVDFERGRAEVSKIARDKRVTFKKATLSENRDSLMDVYRNAFDPATREAALKTAGELYDAAVADGTINVLEAVEGKRAFAGEAAYEHVQSLLNREDVSGAQSYFEAHKDKFSSDQYLSLEGRLKSAGDFRQSIDDVDRAMGGYVPTSDGPAPSMGTMISAITTQESSGQHFDKAGKVKVSSAGAVGLMQVMPGTGPEAAKLAGLPWDEKRLRNDPGYNKALGEAYFKEMLRRFDGDPVKAAAAYNAGPGAVSKALSKGGNWLSKLPEETQNYVANFQRRTGAQQTARRWDKESVFANIDAMADAEGWTPERRERAKDKADDRIARDEQLIARKEADAMRSALDTIDTLGDNFTDVRQIPNFNSLAPDDRLSLEAKAEANRRPKEVPANGPAALAIERASISAPATFIAEDLRKYQHLMTPGEYSRLVLLQDKMREEGPNGKTVRVRTDIAGTISFFTQSDKGLASELDRKKNPENYDKVFNSMNAYIQGITQGKREPTDAELKGAFDQATMKVIVRDRGIFGGDDEVYRFEAKPGERFAVPVPENVRQRIIAAYRQANGKAPPDGLVGSIYLQFKGREGYW